MNAHSSLLTLTLACLVLTLPGCLGKNRRIGSDANRDALSESAENRRVKAARWQRLVAGVEPQRRVVAYARGQLTPAGEQFWVYDPDFQLVGRVTPTGEAFLLNDVPVGVFPVELAIKTVVDRASQGGERVGQDEVPNLELLRMPPPA